MDSVVESTIKLQAEVEEALLQAEKGISKAADDVATKFPGAGDYVRQHVFPVLYHARRHVLASLKEHRGIVASAGERAAVDTSLLRPEVVRVKRDVDREEHGAVASPDVRGLLLAAKRALLSRFFAAASEGPHPLAISLPRTGLADSSALHKLCEEAVRRRHPLSMTLCAIAGDVARLEARLEDGVFGGVRTTIVGDGKPSVISQSPVGFGRVGASPGSEAVAALRSLAKPPAILQGSDAANTHLRRKLFGSDRADEEDEEQDEEGNFAMHFEELPLHEPDEDLLANSVGLMVNGSPSSPKQSKEHKPQNYALSPRKTPSPDTKLVQSAVGIDPSPSPPQAPKTRKLPFQSPNHIPQPRTKSTSSPEPPTSRPSSPTPQTNSSPMPSSPSSVSPTSMGEQHESANEEPSPTQEPVEALHPTPQKSPVKDLNVPKLRVSSVQVGPTVSELHAPKSPFVSSPYSYESSLSVSEEAAAPPPKNTTTLSKAALPDDEALSWDSLVLSDDEEAEGAHPTKQSTHPTKQSKKQSPKKPIVSHPVSKPMALFYRSPDGSVHLAPPTEKSTNTKSPASAASVPKSRSSSQNPPPPSSSSSASSAPKSQRRRPQGGTPSSTSPKKPLQPSRLSYSLQQGGTFAHKSSLGTPPRHELRTPPRSSSSYVATPPSANRGLVSPGKILHWSGQVIDEVVIEEQQNTSRSPKVPNVHRPDKLPTLPPRSPALLKKLPPMTSPAWHIPSGASPGVAISMPRRSPQKY